MIEGLKLISRRVLLRNGIGLHNNVDEGKEVVRMMEDIITTITIITTIISSNNTNITIDQRMKRNIMVDTGIIKTIKIITHTLIMVRWTDK